MTPAFDFREIDEIDPLSRVPPISYASKNLAQGKFDKPLTSKSKDEVGELTANFNSMTRQLKERLQLKAAIGVASEVQQNLLPQEGFKKEGVEIEGIKKEDGVRELLRSSAGRGVQFPTAHAGTPMHRSMRHRSTAFRADCTR